MAKALKSLMGFMLVVFSGYALSETVNEKVARSAANCLVGHSAAKTEKQSSGETSGYISLIESILGSDGAAREIRGATDKLDTAVRLLGSTHKEEGHFLIQKFCPGVDQVLQNRS